MDPSRISRLAGIEAEVKPFDRETEKNVERMIEAAFARIDLMINYNNHSLRYEGDTREATVDLESESITLSQLLRLRETGLASEYTIANFDWGLKVKFVLAEGIENAEMI